jgi:predicted porin
MKKSLIALAVMAAAGAASAQSSVTLFGIVDATLQWGRAGNADRWQLGNSGYNSSRLGFRGTEDLGGGMSASFWLEATHNNDNGTGGATNVNNQTTGGALAGLGGGQGITFNRRSTVSLSSGFGELRLGRDYTPQFFNLTVFDPFGTNGVGTTQTLNSIATIPTAVRASNSIGYFAPANLGGFYGQFQYYMGENAENKQPVGAFAPLATEDDGRGWGLRVGYAAGPFNVALALSKTDYFGANGVTTTGDVKQRNVGGQWDFGVGRLMAHYAFDDIGTADGRGWLVGGLIPVGPGEIRVSYSRYRLEVPAAVDPETRKFALGYVHNLSKRTAVYGTWASLRNRGGATQALNGSVATPGGKSGGFDVGVRHSF